MSKPLLLTVDDDPGVSRAVARDLRRRYGEDYRVVRAGSASEGLDALREIRRLLKPWEPPEEKLYPVVDALVETWRAVGDTPVPDIQVVGHRWSPASYRARDFLARNSLPMASLSACTAMSVRPFLEQHVAEAADDADVAVAVQYGIGPPTVVHRRVQIGAELDDLTMRALTDALEHTPVTDLLRLGLVIRTRIDTRTDTDAAGGGVR